MIITPTHKLVAEGETHVFKVGYYVAQLDPLVLSMQCSTDDKKRSVAIPRCEENSYQILVNNIAQACGADAKEVEEIFIGKKKDIAVKTDVCFN